MSAPRTMRACLGGDTKGSSAIEHVLVLALVAVLSFASWAALGDAVELQARCAAGAIRGGVPSCESGAGASSSSPSGGEPMLDAHDRAAGVATRAQPAPAPAPAAAPQAPPAPPPRSPLDDLFAFGGGFVSGFVDGGVQTVTGTLALGGQVLGATADALTHPAETIATVVDVSTHLDTAVPAALEVGGSVVEGVWHGLEDAGDTLMHGTWEERGHLFGGATFEVASSFVPLSAVTNVAKIGKAGEAAAVVEHGADLATSLDGLAIGAVRRRADDAIEAASDDVTQGLAASEFVTDRSVKLYDDILGNSAAWRIRSLRPDQHWIDMGAGDATAIRDYYRMLDGAPGARTTAVGYARPGPGVDRTAEQAAEIARSYEAFAEATPQFRGLYGKLLEERELAELGRADLVTDVFGPIAYAPHMDEVLETYARVTNPGGEIRTIIPAQTTIVNRAGDVMDSRAFIREYTAHSRGVTLETVRDNVTGVAITLRRTADEVAMPPLKLEYLHAGVPTGRVYLFDP